MATKEEAEEDEEEEMFSEVEEVNPVGEFETRKVQEPGRVNIPEEYLHHIGVDIKDQCAVVCEDGIISIRNPEDITSGLGLNGDEE